MGETEGHTGCGRAESVIRRGTVWEVFRKEVSIGWTKGIGEEMERWGLRERQEAGCGTEERRQGWRIGAG